MQYKTMNANFEEYWNIWIPKEAMPSIMTVDVIKKMVYSFNLFICNIFGFFSFGFSSSFFFFLLLSPYFFPISYLLLMRH
jgi:hypothetical protein